jgi:prephenate dehydratase
MKIIKTLGPETTDSHRATEYWIAKQQDDFEIKTYSCIEMLFNDLNKNDYVLMPAGYSNRKSQEMSSWVDFHFRYLDYLHIQDVFVLDTMSMVILENTSYIIDKAILQSSTYQIFKNCIKDTIEIDYAPSKSKALSLFLEKSYRYVICSEDEILKIGITNSSIKTLQTVYPKMIWVVYNCVQEISNAI